MNSSDIQKTSGIDRIINTIEKYYRFFFCIGIGLVIFLCFYRLGTKYVVSWDEARFGINAYEMIKSKNFIMNTFQYEPDYWNLKPPLAMYATACSFLLFGYNKFALRAASAFCYVVLCVLCALFIKKKFGRLESLFSILFLAANTACFSFHMIRAGDSDSVYILFFTCSMLCMLLIEEKPGMLNGAGFFFACAFLTKSWHAGTIVFVGILYMFLSGEIKKMTWKRWGAFFASFIIPIGIWAVLRFTQDGTAFFREMIFYELITSSQEAIENHQHEFLFYFKNYFWNTWKQYIYGPALLIIVAGAIRFRKELFDKKNRKLVLGAMLWMIVPITWFSIAATKLVWYSYAILIPVLMFAGVLAVWFLKDQKLNGYVRSLMAILLVCMLGFYIHGNIRNIRNEYANKFHDFFEEANDAAPQYEGTDIYLGADGDFGFGVWSQNTAFLAEIHGNHVCKEGSVEAFLQQEDGAVLIMDKKYLDTYSAYLLDVEIAYENEEFIYYYR